MKHQSTPAYLSALSTKCSRLEIICMHLITICSTLGDVRLKQVGGIGKNSQGCLYSDSLWLGILIQLFGQSLGFFSNCQSGWVGGWLLMLMASTSSHTEQVLISMQLFSRQCNAPGSTKIFKTHGSCASSQQTMESVPMMKAAYCLWLSTHSPKAL